MMWTASKPKVDGWYVGLRHIYDDMILVYVDVKSGQVFHGNVVRTQSEFRLWFGPLPQLVPNSVV